MSVTLDTYYCLWVGHLNPVIASHCAHGLYVWGLAGSDNKRI